MYLFKYKINLVYQLFNNIRKLKYNANEIKKFGNRMKYIVFLY